MRHRRAGYIYIPPTNLEIANRYCLLLHIFLCISDSTSPWMSPLYRSSVKKDHLIGNILQSISTVFAECSGCDDTSSTRAWGSDCIEEKGCMYQIKYIAVICSHIWYGPVVLKVEGYRQRLPYICIGFNYSKRQRCSPTTGDRYRSQLRISWVVGSGEMEYRCLQICL